MQPNLAYVITIVTCYTQSPQQPHLDVDKAIFRDLKGIVNYIMCHKKGGSFTPKGFIDVDYANDLKEHKSTLGYLFSLGSGLVSWSSVKQNVVA
jgi:hypothetical protein